jgi:hypothetical protein
MNENNLDDQDLINLRKAEALNFSRPLDVHVWSEHREANSFVDLIYRQLFEKETNIRKKHLKVVLLDLYVAWKENPERFIAVHMSPKDYSGRIDRYNALYIKDTTIRVVKILRENNLIELHKGFQDRKDPSKNRRTRIKSSDSLVKLFTQAKFECKDIARHENYEVIQLKDSNKKLIDYQDTPETQRMRRIVKDYNALLAETEITCGHVSEGDIVSKNGHEVVIDRQHQQVHRVFNNGSFEEGGRFYGAWWQNLPQEHRQNIRINSQPTVELDYTGLHIIMLYGLQGIVYEDDPYHLDQDFGLGEGLQRKVCKKVMLIAINAESEEKALQALRKEVTFPEGFKDGSNCLKSILAAMKEKHQAIAASLCSGVGIKLQFTDSQMIERVIEQFTARKIPVLTVHDSCIVAIDHVPELEQLMKDALINQLKLRQSSDEGLRKFLLAGEEPDLTPSKIKLL